jgi:hypothetical protein
LYIIIFKIILYIKIKIWEIIKCVLNVVMKRRATPLINVKNVEQYFVIVVLQRVLGFTNARIQNVKNGLQIAYS